MSTEMSEKPFACTEENCNMKFTNEDHLNSHKKKHSMSFNLELSAKSNETAIMVSDETPTPTSFFRNCEEVGLFQDLQNVNPFEETFKKALENCDNGAQKLVSLPLMTSEDTLHTPHVFPTADELSHKSILNDNNELSIVNFVEIPQITEKIEVLSGMDWTIKVKEKQDNFRHKLKEALLRKERKRYFQSEHSSTIYTPEPANLVIAEGIIYVNEEDLASKNSHFTIVSENMKCEKMNISPVQKSSIEKVREMNRAAQIRCRDKKKRYYDRVAKELVNLKKENTQLREENTRLRQNTIELWKIIEDLGGIKETHAKGMNVKVIDKNQVQEPSTKKLPVLAPAGKVLIRKNTSVPPQPMIYNLVPVQVLNAAPNSFERSLTVIPNFSPEVKINKSLPRILKKT